MDPDNGHWNALDMPTRDELYRCLGGACIFLGSLGQREALTRTPEGLLRAGGFQGLSFYRFTGQDFRVSGVDSGPRILRPLRSLHPEDPWDGRLCGQAGAHAFLAGGSVELSWFAGFKGLQV